MKIKKQGGKIMICKTCGKKTNSSLKRAGLCAKCAKDMKRLVKSLKKNA